jgi:hypothetical protein
LSMRTVCLRTKYVANLKLGRIDITAMLVCVEHVNVLA